MEEFVEHVCSLQTAGRIVPAISLAQLRGEAFTAVVTLREHCARGLALAAATCDAVPMCAGACRIN